jgi:FAD/FMN-containing dehydrogenase
MECAAPVRCGAIRGAGLPSDGEVCTLWSWGEMHSCRARVFRPSDVGELQTLLAAIQRDPQRDPVTGHGRRVTFRGGGQSLEAQALGDDIVIFVDAPGFVHLSEPVKDEATGEYLVTAGAATRWGHIVETLSKKGFMPYSIVTTSAATVGGTLSADCLSRFSPVSGREGEHVKWFDLVTAQGTLLRCSPKERENADVFRAALGGYGWLGAITQACFRVMKVRADDDTAPVRVRSRAEKADEASLDWDSFLGRLLTRTREESQRYEADPNAEPWRTERAEDAPANAPASSPAQKPLPRRIGPRRPRPAAPPPPRRPLDPSGGQPLSRLPPNEEWQAVSGFGWPSGRGLTMTLVSSRYVATTEPVSPFPLYAPSKLLQDFGQLMFLPSMTLLGQDIAWLLFDEGDAIDELDPFCFFMEKQFTPAKEAWRGRGRRLGIAQQTYVIPLGGSESLASQVRPTKHFLETMAERLRSDDIHPLVVDVLFLRADDFLLSANRGRSGFAVTLTLASLDAHQLDSDYRCTVAPRLSELSTICQQLGGRVHLVKNVCADPLVLRKMYGEAWAELRVLKDRLDPKDTLKNAFFERLFEGEAEASRCP